MKASSMGKNICARTCEHFTEFQLHWALADNIVLRFGSLTRTAIDARPHDKVRVLGIQIRAHLGNLHAEVLVANAMGAEVVADQLDGHGSRANTRRYDEARREPISVLQKLTSNHFTELLDRNPIFAKR